MPSVIIDMSSSMSVFVDKRDPIGGHFRWDSIKKFIFIACTYSNSVYNFDIFSKVRTFTAVNLYEFLTVQFLMGTPYMFMDFFIKLYTRRIDAQNLLNPLMRGVSYAIFLQTFMWALIHSQYAADTLHFLFLSFRTLPGWSECNINIAKINLTCIPAAEMLYKCQGEGVKSVIKFQHTSSHQYYEQSFLNFDRTIMTKRYFILAIVWAANFFFSTVSDETVLKIFRLSFTVRSVSTIIILIFLYFSARRTSSVTAFYDILKKGENHTLLGATRHVSYMNGIGFLGLHDFSSMSVFTMVDNAVIIYTILFTVTALIRSWVVRLMYIELTSCVKIEASLGLHYIVYAVLPMSTEFFHAHKLYVFYLYVNLMFSTMAYLIMLTLTMAKVLHSEFSSVKNIYLVGMLCCLGLGVSLIFVTVPPYENIIVGMRKGIDLTSMYLGFLKTSLIMWMYGVETFSTDIQFWLGFKPTKYWTLCWFCLPIMLFACVIGKIYWMYHIQNMKLIMGAAVWMIVIVSTTAIFQIKTVIKFLMKNNLVNVLSANKRYGPPDAEDRKRRKHFDETLQLRQCKHNCHPFDEMIDCTHLPLIRTSSGNMIYDEHFDSLTNLYEARPTMTRLRTSAAMDVT